jgi:CRISPR system Cascade subunit CasB
MAMTNDTKVSSPATEFVDRLATLPRGELAILKRNANNTLSESRNAIGIFYRLLPPSKQNGPDEEIYFLVATLYGCNKYSGTGDFGLVMRRVKGSTGDAVGSGVDRRMSILLDSEFGLIDGYRHGGGEMAYRMRQCVLLAGNKEVGIDWEQLLHDLCRWQQPGKRVRKQWARSYFGIQASQENQSN